MRVVQVVEEHEAEAGLGNEREVGAKAVDRAAVHEQVLAAIVLNHPTHAVTELEGGGTHDPGIAFEGNHDLR